MIYDVRNISFSYDTEIRKVLDDVSLSISSGDILCILGPNGAGKTTLLNCMAGLLRPESGEILLKGKNIKELRQREIAKLVGFVPQLHTPSFDYTALDFVLMGRAPKTALFSQPKSDDEIMCLDVLRSMKLEHLAHKSYLNISGGERQQLLIARAIIQEPEVVLFDEPTAHLDFGNQHRVLKRIRKMAEDGFSVVITTHNPEHALLLDDKVVIVDKTGHITQGRCDEVITEENLKRIYGIDISLRYVEELGRKTCFVPGL